MSSLRKLALVIGFGFVLSASASLVELQNANEFQSLVQSAEVPVLVQFSAYWCGPCKNLSGVLSKVASSYGDDEVILAKVDAYVNSSLQKYLGGGYPTVRTFYQGNMTSKSFVGSQTESFVRTFIDGLIESPTRGEFFAHSGDSCPIE